jgi:hypothetical protein
VCSVPALARAARWLLVLAPLAVMVLAACTPGPNPQAGTPGPDGDVAGFWLGLWHGFIALVSFVVSLFHDGVAVYEVHNRGALYDLGFVLGLMFFFGGGSGAGHGARKR